MNEITDQLKQWKYGDVAAKDELMSQIYDELREIAAQYLRKERAHHTLQPTALANEAYLRLVKIDDIEWKDRTHFFAVSATIIRHVLIDYARARSTQKRKGIYQPLELEDALEFSITPETDLLALDEALDELAKFGPRQSKIVELRFFGGLTIEETARVIGMSTASVKREWVIAKSWLYRKLQSR